MGRVCKIGLGVTPWDELNWQGQEFSRQSLLESDKIISFQITRGVRNAIADAFG